MKTTERSITVIKFDLEARYAYTYAYVKRNEQPASDAHVVD